MSKGMGGPLLSTMGVRVAESASVGTREHCRNRYSLSCQPIDWEGRVVFVGEVPTLQTD